MSDSDTRIVKAISDVSITDSSGKSIHPEPPAPCNEEKTGSGKKEDPEGFIGNTKTGFTQAENSFCQKSSESSGTYLELVRSQQDFCKNSTAESNEKPNNFHADRDFFRGLDGVLMKIIPFYIFKQ